MLVKSKPSQCDYGYFVWCYLFLFYCFFLFIFPYRIYHSDRSALPQCGCAELSSPVNFLVDRSICHATMALCQRYDFICRYVNICAYICVYICVKYCFRLPGHDLQSLLMLGHSFPLVIQGLVGSCFMQHCPFSAMLCYCIHLVFFSRAVHFCVRVRSLFWMPFSRLKSVLHHLIFATLQHPVHLPDEWQNTLCVFVHVCLHYAV